MADDKKTDVDPWATGNYTFSLEKPIVTEDGETKSLTLRKPTGADIMAVGNPVEFNPLTEPPTIRIRDREMGAMLSRLANLSPVGIGRMEPKDFINAGWVVVPFFIPV